MNTFVLELRDGTGINRFESVTQFIGADESGSFGIMAGHAHFVSVLRYGLARFCDQEGLWRYIALPGGVLSFSKNLLTVVTVRYFLGERDSICQQLADAMAKTDSEIYISRTTMAEIEHSLIRRLGELGREDH